MRSPAFRSAHFSRHFSKKNTTTLACRLLPDVHRSGSVRCFLTPASLVRVASSADWRCRAREATARGPSTQAGGVGGPAELCAFRSLCHTVSWTREEHISKHIKANNGMLVYLELNRYMYWMESASIYLLFVIKWYIPYLLHLDHKLVCVSCVIDVNYLIYAMYQSVEYLDVPCIS